jgi:hypothetical protein
MQELISKLTSQVGLSEDQAKKALSVISQFVKDKYPAVGGMVDNLLGGSKGEEGSGGFNLGGFKM